LEDLQEDFAGHDDPGCRQLLFRSPPPPGGRGPELPSMCYPCPENDVLPMSRIAPPSWGPAAVAPSGRVGQVLARGEGTATLPHPGDPPAPLFLREGWGGVACRRDTPNCGAGKPACCASGLAGGLRPQRGDPSWGPRRGRPFAALRARRRAANKHGAATSPGRPHTAPLIEVAKVEGGPGGGGEGVRARSQVRRAWRVSSAKGRARESA
jgi:hypothetical protein